MKTDRIPRHDIRNAPEPPTLWQRTLEDASDEVQAAMALGVVLLLLVGWMVLAW